MSFLAQGVFALCYVALAAVVGFALSMSGVGVEPPVAAVAGAAVAMVGAFLHQSLVGARRDRSLVEVLHGMSAAQTKLESALSGSRHEVRQLVMAFDKAARNLTGRDSEVAAEMRMLQTLLQQFSPRREGDQAAEKPPAPAVAVPTEGPNDVDEERVIAIIHDALGNNRVDVYLQPVVSLPQRKALFYETYSRLRAADGAQIEPADYLGVAERSGLIAAIDNNLLFRCVQLVRKTQRRNLKLGFFCNISPYTLRDGSFFPEFIDFMEHNIRLASNLVFEFSQADLASHDAPIVDNLDRLGDMGFRFSIDRLDTLELDIDKLVDRHVSFVKADAGTLLERLADTAGSVELHRMKRTLDRAGICLVVEKIEEEAQLVELLDYGIDFGQGYLFGAPRLSRDAD
ncbi:MAG: EAL domain-containing protein [Alphaproteobacteria bacterium]